MQQQPALAILPVMADIENAQAERLNAEQCSGVREMLTRFRHKHRWPEAPATDDPAQTSYRHYGMGNRISSQDPDSPRVIGSDGFAEAWRPAWLRRSCQP
ncbi:MAG: hypothetical protein VKI42_04110 [Synechococcaceae cyanobacterium]|nr:hypothetical protein [Synechococcaceae cyanobacterium]